VPFDPLTGIGARPFHFSGTWNSHFGPLVPVHLRPACNGEDKARGFLLGHHRWCLSRVLGSPTTGFNDSMMSHGTVTVDGTKQDSDTQDGDQASPVTGGVPMEMTLVGSQDSAIDVAHNPRTKGLCNTTL
jgi:hypothetical protein